MEVASETFFTGHEPIRPLIEYFSNESDINTLIDQRMNQNNPILYKKITLKYSNTSGISHDDAIKIEAALQKMKIGGNTSISSEMQEENRMYFEYEIKFPSKEN